MSLGCRSSCFTFLYLVLVQCDRAYPLIPHLALERLQKPVFGNSSAVSAAWQAQIIGAKRRALKAGSSPWRPHSPLAVPTGFGAAEESELPRTGTALVIYPAHDSSVAVSVDGHIQCVLELERLFARRYFWPTLEEERKVWRMALHFVRDRCYCETQPCPTSFDYGAVVLFSADPSTDRAEYSQLPRIVEDVFEVRQWRLVDHHEAHARMSFHDSRFSSALVVSFDGSGNDGTFNVYFGSGRQLYRLGQLGFQLGFRYITLAAFLTEISQHNLDIHCKNFTEIAEAKSFAPQSLVNLHDYKFTLLDHEGWAGKMMAYAALGPRSAEMDELVRWYYRNSSAGSDYVPAELILGACASLEGQRAIAAAAQAEFEDYVLDLVRAIIQEVSDLGIPDPEGLVLSGGCALNVRTNQRILDEVLETRAPDKQMGLHVTAAPNDSGVTVGGSWAIVPPNQWQPLQYIGFHLWDTPFLPDHVKTWDAKNFYSLGGVEYLADLLSGGPAWLAERGHQAATPIIGIVRDRQEFGPRALGHRSLLAVPNSVEIRDRMNRLKFRQWFRPVAPMIAEEALEEVFGRTVKSTYMSMAPKVRPEVLAKFPALSHLDGTARHQSVSREDEPWIHALLLAVGRRIGLAALINTSFNTKGKPIINRAEDCLKMLEEMPDLDYVLIEDWLFRAPATKVKPTAPDVPTHFTQAAAARDSVVSNFFNFLHSGRSGYVLLCPSAVHEARAECVLKVTCFAYDVDVPVGLLPHTQPCLPLFAPAFVLTSRDATTSLRRGCEHCTPQPRVRPYSLEASQPF
ncbi:tobZ [Symbiodinium necroappetens]|uniref:TobZ protein n=1 Tax=Symbiodinium necroappetens TaxID=1628268 RepID=A0A812PGV3_9DINO|nr:tobZ [Symbiodinium necroappetens]